MEALYRNVIRPRQGLLDSEELALEQLKAAAAIPTHGLLRVPLEDKYIDGVFGMVKANETQGELLLGNGGAPLVGGPLVGGGGGAPPPPPPGQGGNGGQPPQPPGDGMQPPRPANPMPQPPPPPPRIGGSGNGGDGGGGGGPMPQRR